MKRSEKVIMWIAFKLPKRLAYWAFIRVWSYATTGKYGNEHPLKVSYNEIAKRWERQDAHDKA